MLFSSLAVVALAALSASAAPVAEVQDIDKRATCVSGNAVHIIVARASTEPQGEGILASVSSSVKNQLPGSDSVAVVYPALLSPYITSETTGARAMASLVDSYSASCPDSKIVLMGYSQGAQVVGDVLNGVTGVVSATTAKNIVAVIQMGDPSHKVGVAGNEGTSIRNGLFPRRDSSKTANFAVQAYCDTLDTFCDSGFSTAVHLSYIQRYGSAAASYVVSKATA